MHAVWIGLVALLLAGCATPEPDRKMNTGATDTALSSGGSGTTDSSSMGVASVERASRLEPIRWEGSTGSGACVPTGPAGFGCYGVFEGTGWLHTLEANGTLTHIAVNLTWTPDSVVTERLNLFVDVFDPCPQCPGDWINARTVASAGGASPLALASELPELDDGQAVGFVVQVPSQAPPPAGVLAYTDQSFTLEGVATVV